jgi:NDP-sugar pyrophosphorylase family protein
MMPDAVILCGGAGLRLKSVTGDAPKSMASVAGRPFMEFLLLQLKRYGFSRVVLSVGYQQQVIRNHFGAEAFGLKILYSSESSPLGTGGALRQAVSLITTETALVMNGDSYTDVDLQQVAATHSKNNADLTVVVFAEDRADAGTVLLDQNKKITTFAEKRPVDSARYRSAGIYVLNKPLMDRVPHAVKVSLEEQIFPGWIAEGRNVQAFVHPGKCVDIGTPERFQGAQDIFASVETAESASRNEGQL